MDINFCPYCMNPVKEGETCKICGLKEGAYEPKEHHLPLGTVLQERYLIGRVLGEGGFGITYIGRDLRLDRKVAVKEYYPTDKVYRYSQASLRISPYGHALKSFQSGREKFLREAQTMALLEKLPNIVSARDYFEENDTAYIVMEYVEGTTLKEMVSQRGGRIPAEELFDLLKPLFPALSSVHELGLIHRDISPDNLMLEKGKIRLLDFGCARDTTTQAETRTIALKQGYAPIEQYQQKGQGTWTDVYALSATIYYCLTGKTPQSAVDRLDEDELVPPRQLGVKLSPEKEAALMKGMELSYRNRYQTVEELYEGLYQEKHPSVRRKRLAAALAACGAVLLLAAAGGMVYLGRSGQEQTPDGSGTMEISSGSEPRREPFTQESASTESSVPPSSTGQASGEGAAGGGSDLEDLFAQAAVLEEFSGEKLQGLLADDSVAAVRIASGNGSSSRESLGAITVTKPLLIDSDAYLSLYDMITVQGENACVWIKGHISGMYNIRTLDGGRLIVDDGAEVNGMYFLWMEDDRDLEIGDGVELHFEEQLLGNFKSRFPDAVEVKDEQALRRAAGEGANIVVAGDIALQDSLEVHSPVLVSEGVSLSADGDISLKLSNTELWNQGELHLGLEMQQCERLVNEGRIQAALTLTDCEEVVNVGEISMQKGSEKESGRLIYNMGTLNLNGRKTELFYNLRNYGSLVLQKGQELRLVGGTWVNNFGDLAVDSGAHLVNGNYLCNEDDGRVLLRGGAVLANQGVLQMNGGELDVEEGAEFQNENGAVIYRYPEEKIPVEDGILAVLHKADTFELDGSTMEVGNAQALKEMLASPDVMRIMIRGAVQWPEESLTIDKEVEIASDGSLTLGDGTELVVDGGILLNDGLLQADRMTLRRGGAFVNTREFDLTDADSLLTLEGGQEGSADGTVCFHNNGTCDLKGGLLEISGRAVGCNLRILKEAGFRISESGCLIHLGQLEWLAGGTLQLSGGGEFRSLVYEDCNAEFTFDVQEGGRLLFSAGSQIAGGNLRLAPGAFMKIGNGHYNFLEGTTLVNEGQVVLENSVLHLQDSCTNRGSMEISGRCELHLNGKKASCVLDNQGEIRVLPEEDSPGPFSLYLENGVLTGNDIVYE